MTYIAGHATATYSRNSDATSSSVECTVSAFEKSGTFDMSTFAAGVTKYRPSTAEQPRKLNLSKRNESEPNDDRIDLMTRKYPGAGSTSSPLVLFWACGPFTVSFGAHPPFDVFHLDTHPSEAFWAVAESSIERICGTLNKPAQSITDDPTATWLIYHTLGGTQPSEYGVKRPDIVPTNAISASSEPGSSRNGSQTPGKATP